MKKYKAVLKVILIFNTAFLYNIPILKHCFGVDCCEGDALKRLPGHTLCLDFAKKVQLYL